MVNAGMGAKMNVFKSWVEAFLGSLAGTVRYSGYGGYSGRSQSYGGGGFADLLDGTILPVLTPILGLLVVFFAVRAVLKQLKKAQSGGGDLMPRGEPMRYALASIVLEGTLFRRSIIDAANNPFKAAAPEQGLEYPLLVAAARRYEFEDRTWQWVFTGLVAGAWLIVPLLAAAIGNLIGYRAAGAVALLAPLAILAAFGLAFYRRWQIRFALVQPYLRENFSLEAARERVGGEATDVATFVPQQSNIVVYGQNVPFVGMGYPASSWQVGIDTNRPGTAAQPIPVRADDVFDAVERAIADLNMPGLQHSLVGFANGTETALNPLLQPDKFSRPKQVLDLFQLASWRAKPDMPVRVYSWFHIPTSNGEIVYNYLFRATLRGDALGVEAVQLIVPPIAKRFRAVDAMPRLRFWGMVQWVITAIALTPLTVLGGLLGAAGQVREAIGNLFGGPEARERREIETDPIYNYGPAWSLRERISDTALRSYFHDADGAQVLKVINLQVINALLDLLKARGIDTSSLEQQAIVVQQTSVNVSTGGGAVSLGAGANLGGIASTAAGIVTGRSGRG